MIIKYKPNKQKEEIKKEKESDKNMKSASENELTFEKAKYKDINDIVDLIYITEPEPEEEWGYGSEKQRKQTLKKLMKSKDNRFSIQHIIVARKKHQLVGMALLLEGKEIEKLTANSEKFVMQSQKNAWQKLGCFWNKVKGKFYFECDQDEFYIANIAIKPEYRGNGYAKLIFERAYQIAKQKGYQKASLIAKNDKLISFYRKLGYTLVNSKLRRMVISI